MVRVIAHEVADMFWHFFGMCECKDATKPGLSPQEKRTELNASLMRGLAYYSYWSLGMFILDWLQVTLNFRF